jgi:hypothetical protein
MRISFCSLLALIKYLEIRIRQIITREIIKTYATSIIIGAMTSAFIARIL